MKELKGWDAYVKEANATATQEIRLPLFDDEEYVITYPNRAQGKALAAAQANGDTDGVVMALLGDEAGKRVLELSDQFPATVLDLMILDVLRKFGFVDEDSESDSAEDTAETTQKATAKAAGKSRATGTRGRSTKQGKGSQRSSAA